jgi:creatinine amidohydrolase
MRTGTRIGLCRVRSLNFHAAVIPVAGRPFILTETTWSSVKQTEYDVAVLPWGATEAHNYHLPYGADTLQSEGIAAEAARLAWDEGAGVIVLPAVPFGVQSGQLDIPLCLHMNPSTQASLLADLAHTLAGQRVRKLVILNGHGGNDFRAMIRELQPRVRIFLCALNWYTCLDPRPFFEQPGDHAGELETSLLLHLHPRLVLPLETAGSGEERRFRVAGLREGWAWAPRQWTRISADTGVGDPKAATAAKGERYFRAVTERIASFICELAAADPEQLYE